MFRLAKRISIALLVLWAAGAEGEIKAAAASQPSDAPALADVDLDEVPIGRALRLLAETYDVSIATGSLPDARVTVRLRNIGAREAFAAVADAAGLAVSQDGAIMRVSPKSSPAEIAAAHGIALRQQITDRVFHLGVAPGEETLKAIQPLLSPDLEVATYNATGNLLTVSALPVTLERIATLLSELTRTPKQFEIEVQVVEVTKEALRRMGAQGTFGLDIRGGVLATTFPLSGLTDSQRYIPSPRDLSALGRLSTGGTGGGEPGSFSDPGFRFGKIDARGIGLLIQALEQSGEARVMATPKVTALDNRQARISMVTTLRIPTFTQSDAFAATTVTGIEQVDVGTTLEVRPRSGSGGQILLTVTPEVSELQPNATTVTQNGLTQGLPIVTRRRTETEVILGSGDTLIIGGLVTERTRETHGKTPGLSKIPGIGRAFRLEGNETVSTELLVFVTPRELPMPAAPASPSTGDLP
jgi:type II secretory pathway component GspD/PulD (secretin)